MPGAGKTTSLQHYAYLQAKVSSRQSAASFALCRIYVELRYYQASHPEGGLWRLAQKSPGGQQWLAGMTVASSNSAEKLPRGNGILLLDGLNEVPRTTSRSKPCGNWNGADWSSIRQARLVITSRRDVPLERLKLPVFRLDRLTDDQIVDFLKRHFPDKRQAETFARTLRRNPRLWDWGRNPLQLWMLAQVGLKAKGGLPENRGQLLRRFVEYLLRREESKGPQTPRDIKLDLLSEIGYQTRQSGRVSFPRSAGLADCQTALPGDSIMGWIRSSLPTKCATIICWPTRGSNWRLPMKCIRSTLPPAV
jgi:predicted NACHT family NTPase